MFTKRLKTDMSGLSIRAMYNLVPTKGDVGIEIEVEGNQFKKQGVPSPWKYVKDGSLRGQDNAEYVLNGPIDFDAVPAATKKLWKMFADYGSVLDDSNRTSVHVHMNVQEWHLNRLASFLCAYYTVEEILTEFCGEHRVGNLFCLRGKDAPGLVSRIRRLIRIGEAQSFTDGLHYGALNPQAIQKYGSVEIRTMRGAMEAEEVDQWVSILRRIYDLSASFPDPRALVDLFSGEGPSAFLDLILGEYRTIVLEGVSFDHQRVLQSLYDGILIAQDIAYCREWETFKEISVKPDPFGRSIKKVAAALTANEAMNSYNATDFWAQAQAQAQLMYPGTQTIQPMHAPAPAVGTTMILDDFEPVEDYSFDDEDD